MSMHGEDEVKQQTDGAGSIAAVSIHSPAASHRAGGGLTTRRFTQVELDPQQTESIARVVPGGEQNIADIYPLSPLQEGMLFHRLLHEQSDSYVLSTYLEVQHAEQSDRLVDALQAVVDRHDVLRTAVLWEKLPRPLQVVHRRVQVPVHELRIDPRRDALAQLKDHVRSERHNISVHRAPMVCLWLTHDPHSSRRYAAILVHHLVCDFQSMTALLDEVMACLDERNSSLPEPISFKEYVTETLASYDSRAREAQAFFRRKLGDIHGPTAPFGIVQTLSDSREVRQARLVLDADLTRRIRAQARHCSVSVARLFHAAWAVVVANTSGTREALFGTVVLSARQRGPRAAVPRMLGSSINTLPLRVPLDGISARELVANTDRELAELLQYEAAPLTVAQHCSGIAVSAPLFTAILNVRRSASDEPQENFAEVRGIRVIERIGAGTNYPIAISVNDSGATIELFAGADPRIEPHRVVDYLKMALCSLVEALEERPHTPALELRVLPSHEHHQLTVRFNATRSVHARNSFVHELIEERARCAPEAAAVICGEQQLTYAELNDRANRLANTLRGMGVRPDDRVGVYAERCVELVVGLLGVMKAAAAYVPMDVSYPRERLVHMLRDSTPAAVLTQSRLLSTLPSTDIPVVLLDADPVMMDDAYPRDPTVEQLGLTPRHLAYVIYTSGSTGTPKGVMVEHRNLSNLVAWHCEAFELNARSRCSSVASTGFDAATWEIWPPLSVGATLVLAPAAVVEDVQRLLEWWARQSLQVSFLPTPLAELAFDRNAFPQELRTLLVGGDRLRYLPAHAPFKVVNNYGPTECTVVATSGHVRAGSAALHIGRPMANTQTYILNERGHVVAAGVTGEIFVGGVGVARGYLNRPELTGERFIPDPFSVDAGAVMYRTGDLGRWLEDGTIEYIGRNDQQVKIRGFRIELGEIERQLANHEGVRDAVVMAREDVPGQKNLVAYVIPEALPDAMGPVSTEALRSHLKRVLPEYMVPNAFVMLAQLPLTHNGKLDRRALPVPGSEAYVSRPHEPASGAEEVALVSMWKNVLKAERVGRHDSFFELGGDSLLVLRVLPLINERFNCSLRVADIYKHPCLCDLAARIRGATAAEDEHIDLSQEVTSDRFSVVGHRHDAPVQAILLTGATGFVGRFLLVQLLEDTRATIYCLVRASSAHEASRRLRTTLLKWGLWRKEMDTRVVVMAGDLRRAKLGIEDGLYATLCQTVDSIYHCATSMNHLETYAMARSTNVESVWELLKLASSGKPKQINYLSTLSVFNGATGPTQRIVDETTEIDQEKHSKGRGYVASKWVGEKILLTARERNLSCNIFRLGLVWVDTEQGRYDELQREYRLLKSCLLSGYGIEKYHLPMVPTPVDYVARAVSFLANRYPGGHGIFHIACSLQAIDGLFECCNEAAGTSLHLLPEYDWIREIRRLHHEGMSLPIVPLIEFAFERDRDAFSELQRRARAARVRFDCTRTHRELEAGGIVAPVVDARMVRLCVENVLSRDISSTSVASCEPAARRDSRPALSSI